ncbi:MAG: ABC transporter permease, partial [Calditrichaeota bacterium]|nr:ABC transporter permease [Calditrichota bacterium]
MRRLFAVAHKELRHIWRDPRSLFVAIMMPLAMVVIYSYAIDMDLRSLRIGLLDLDRTTASDALVREAVSSGYIVIA